MENELNKPLELFTVEEINNLCMDFRNSGVDGRTYFKFVKYLERFFDNKKINLWGELYYGIKNIIQ